MLDHPMQAAAPMQQLRQAAALHGGAFAACGARARCKAAPSCGGFMGWAACAVPGLHALLAWLALAASTSTTCGAAGVGLLVVGS